MRDINKLCVKPTYLLLLAIYTGTLYITCPVAPTVQNRPYFYANYLRNTDGMLINTEAI